MCGIYLAGSVRQKCSVPQEVIKGLDGRGPDSIGIVRKRLDLNTDLQLSSSNPSLHLTFVASVLHLRGEQPVAQPILDPDTGSILCWNGEGWKFGNHAIAGNDGLFVLERLTAFSKTTAPDQVHQKQSRIDDRTRDSTSEHSSLACFFGQLKGPFAFVFYDAPRHRIFFGRDKLGRRSLLYKHTHDQQLVISSVTDGQDSGVWFEVGTNGIYMVELKSLANLNFPSGGDESEYQSQFFVPLLAWTDLKQLGFPHLNRVTDGNPHSLDYQIEELKQHLLAALVPRVTQIPSLGTLGTTHANLAILFSGGLDCTLLANLTHSIVPLNEPIDLLNVAFENPRVLKAVRAGSELANEHQREELLYETCPDRMTARASLAELQVTCVGRQWRLVAINIPYSETSAHKSRVIKLMHPHNTEMDLSISLALYFASRGRGQVGGRDYATPARVLISGFGADELFGGYSRHAHAFERKGYEALLDELELDFGRISRRNLGRDDRVLSPWGREVRYPFLDEDFVSWSLRCDARVKTGFGIQIREPDYPQGKWLLRSLANTLGLRLTAREKKRAIQFGARTAKMTSAKTRGDDAICSP